VNFFGADACCVSEEPLPLLFGVVGGCMAVAGPVLFCIRARRFSSWVRTHGTVVGQVESGNSEGISFKPKVAFETREGERIQFVSHVSGSGAASGRSVPVIYNPKDPNEASIDRFMYRHLSEVVIFVLGLALSVLFVAKRF
jgi:hypothetical protein